MNIKVKNALFFIKNYFVYILYIDMIKIKPIIKYHNELKSKNARYKNLHYMKVVRENLKNNSEHFKKEYQLKKIKKIDELQKKGWIREPKIYSLCLRTYYLHLKYSDKYELYNLALLELQYYLYKRLWGSSDPDESYGDVFRQYYTKKMIKIEEIKNKYERIYDLFLKVNFTAEERIKALKG
jgi:hypothetical protein